MQKFWVNGGGLWNDTFHWSTTSGGSGGTAIPTSVDNVRFDAASFSVAGTVSLNVIANCLDLDFTGIDVAVLFSSSVYSINIHGSLTLWTGLTWTFTGTAYTYLKATDSRNITSNGVSFNTNIIYLDSINAIWNILDTFTSTANINFINGRLITNGNTLSFNYWSWFVGSFRLTLDNSNIYIGGMSQTGLTTLTLDSNTSTINIKGSIRTLNNGNWYNIVHTGTGNISECKAYSLTTKGNLQLTTNIEPINLYIIGDSALIRSELNSFNKDIQRTITVDPTKVFASNCDFQNIKFSSPVDLSNIVGGSQDFGNNSNIIFTPGIDCYYKGTTGAHNWSANWKAIDRTTSVRVPLIQDNANFDDQSFTGASTVNLDIAATCKNINFTGIDKALTLASSVNSLKIYGDTTLAPNLVWSFTGTAYTYMSGLGSFNITTNGVIATMNKLYFDRVGGIWAHQDDFNIGTGSLQINGGVWNTNDKTITIGTSFGDSLSNAGFKKIANLGSSVINCSNVWQMGFGNFVQINCGTSTINTNGIEFYAYMPVYNLILTNKCTVWGAGTTYNNITASKTCNLHSAGVDVIITDTLSVNGINNSDRALLSGGQIGTVQNIIASNVHFSYCDFRDIKGLGTANWDLSAIPGGSGDCGGNSNIIFTPSQTQYYKHTSGVCNWSDAKWYDLSRTILGRVPLPQDDAIFDDLSFTGTSTLSINVPRICRSLDMSSVNQSVTVTPNNAIDCYGGYILSSYITWTTTLITNFMGRGTYSIDTKGVTIPTMYINCATGIYNLISDITLSSVATIVSGTFNSNDKNINITTYFVMGGGTFNAGSSIITINGATLYWTINAGTFNCGTSKIICLYNGTSTIEFRSSNIYNIIQFSGNPTSIGSSSFIGSNIINELIIDAGRKVRFTAGTTTTIGKLTAIGTPSQPITIGSVTAATHNLVKTGTDVVEVEYCNISNSNATPIDKWSAGETSVDGGGNIGWTFKFIPIVMWF